MLEQVLKVKLHRATVTEAEVNYHGSLSIDEDLMDHCGIRRYEKVLVGNMTNGQRFETYVIPAERGSGTMGVNGGAARLCSVGDRLVVMIFVLATPDEKVKPKVVVLDEQNRVVEDLDYDVGA